MRFVFFQSAWLLTLLSSLICSALANPGNRLAWLDGPLDPYYVSHQFPRLTTHQWTGDPKIDAVVVLAIDDMRDVQRYERFLRPILDRLKRYPAPAGLSIMTNRIDPADAHLQQWLREGVNLETHTLDHPCPLLQKGDFAAARRTYDGCVDLMASIPGNHPVAFRMPCCDSRNTPSPRFWQEIFNGRTENGHFLQVDSSVFQLFTPADPELPRDLVFDESGAPRFARYVPFPSFVNLIYNYPYPYVIGQLCWEFPCMVPSDWEAQHVQQPNNPRTVQDWCRALDATVAKRGVFNLVFHPHGWIRAEQIVELIDYAEKTYGDRVRFWSFRQALDQLNRHLLAGHPLRNKNGSDNGVRVLDLNDDGYMDVVIGNSEAQLTRLWQPDQLRWKELPFPVRLVDDELTEMGVRWGIVGSPDQPVLLALNERQRSAWRFTETGWKEEPQLLEGLQHNGAPVLAVRGGQDLGIRLYDVDGDETCELVAAGPALRATFVWHSRARRWELVGATVPSPAAFVDERGRDAGLRLVDVNGDGCLDALWSNEKHYGLALFRDRQHGWDVEALRGTRPEGNAIPPISLNGTNNGAWFHSRHLWVQNETTDRLPDLVDRRSFDQLIAQADHQRLRQRDFVPVGTAKIDITPSYPVRLSGYGSRRFPHEGVDQRIWARALAIGDDGAPGPLVLLSVENCGVPLSMRREVLQRVEQSAVHLQSLVICSTHTHSAPWLPDAVPFMFPLPVPPDHEAAVKRYTRELTQQLVEVVKAALAQRRPARLAWGQGRVDFAVNRRVLKEGRWAGFGENPDGPVDHSLPVLVARDQNDRVIALVANYACHCTTLGGNYNRICGDWAGFAQEIMEEQHPGAIGMVVIGCGADANPKERGSLEACRKQGALVAREVERLLREPEQLKPLSQLPIAREAVIPLPLDDPPGREYWEKEARRSDAAGARARYFLKLLEQNKPLPRSFDYVITTWIFGKDLAMVFLAGEVVVDYAIRLKQEFDDSRLWITSYANDVPCYIASRRILREGGYEADSSMIYYGKPTRLSEEAEDWIVDTVQRLLPPEFYSKEKQQEFPPPMSPEESLQAIQVREGLRVELVAAEPLVVDPVAFDWGPDGKLWVVEMRDYPDGMDGKGKPGGRVKFLVDADQDGRYDQATVFLDDLPFPTGVKVWRDGILVTAAPRVLFARDQNGDGRADQVETLYEGFGEGNQQHRVNGLRGGVDNWLYLGNGDSGGTIRSLKTGELVNVNGRDLRIRPDEGLMDVQAGQTQYGRCCDDWGNWFGGNNSFPMWHYVLHDEYLRRNPYLPVPAIRKQVSVQPGPAPVYPISRTLQRFNDFDKANRFTSACSPIIYRDNWLGPEYYGNAFVCEPVHNLVHREVMEQQGVTFISRRAPGEQQSEFLASRDNWFRPVMIRTGPDGALWIADMYRFVIEHPKWIPMRFQRRLDLRAGEHMGRIYRVVPEERGARPVPRLDQMTNHQLVSVLESPNGFLRDLAQQMLLWRHAVDAAEALRHLVHSSQQPTARLHALWTLEGLGQLDQTTLLAALRDGHPGVRRHAVRLAEPRLGQSPPLLQAVLALLDDPDPFIQLQLCYTLGEVDDPRAAAALGTLAIRHHSDVYLRTALLSSVNKDNLPTLLLMVLGDDGASRAVELVEPLVRMATAMGRSEVLGEALRRLETGEQGRVLEPWRFRAVAGILDTLARRRLSLEKALDAEGRARLLNWVQRAHAVAADPKQPLPLRLAALNLTGRLPSQRAAELALLSELLQPQHPVAVQEAAIAALERIGSEEAVRILLSDWSQRSPGLRSAILDAVLRRPTATLQLLAALQSGDIPLAHLDARRRHELLAYPDERVRSQAQTLLNAQGKSSSRAEVVARYEAQVAALRGEVSRGRAVFEKRCATCHRLDGVGHAVGPDLSALTDKSTTALLTAILDPNRSVESKFLDFVVVTVEGKQYSGIVTAETSNSITLLGQEGREVTVLRDEIELLQTTGKSMMPEGLERDLSAQDLADLIAYLRSVGPAPKSFPGNTPQVAPVRDDGSIRCFAMHARIYGPTLVFEETHRNLGYWQSMEDRAVWSLNVPRAGKYRVYLVYACADEVAGNHFLIEVAGQKLGGRVIGTGGWNHYRTITVGTVELPEGPCELTVRSDGPIRGALMDLEVIRLIPVDR